MLLATVFWCTGCGSEPQTPVPKLLARAYALLNQQKYAEAAEYARKALSQAPDSRRALLIVGEAAGQQGNLDEAFEYFSHIPDDGSPEFVESRYRTGAFLMYEGHFSLAETILREVLETNPDHPGVHEHLGNLLTICGRRWEAFPHQQKVLRAGRADLRLLRAIADMEYIVRSPDLDKARKVEPHGILPLIGLARVAIRRGRFEDAEEWLRTVLEKDPDQIEAYVSLGRLLVDRDPAEFVHWHEGLPEDADRHPETWILRGQWARRNGELKAAARCFTEALKMYPDHRAANYQLGQALRDLSRVKDAEPFLTRSEQLSGLAERMLFLRTSLRKDPTASAAGSPETLQQCGDMMFAMGRRWEGWAWYQQAHKRSPLDPETVRELDALQRELIAGDEAWVAADNNPAAALDVSDYPLPTFNAADYQPFENSHSGEFAASFENMAAAAGIRFTYQNARDPTTEGSRIVETLGGGVGVVDFDLDGWPDIYFSQGGDFPPHGEQSGKYRDQFYRNLADGRFIDVAHLAGFDGIGFGLGVTAGDFDQDGFPDIHLCNISRNQLYLNNGDGTFRDVTDTAGVGGDDWSTSAALADLDGDAVPDLYVVNYLAGEDPLTRLCGSDGERVCSPLGFQSAQDRVYVGSGDGRFFDLTSTAGIVSKRGYGLGVVAGDFDASGRLSVFVANDQTFNFFFVNETAAGGPLAFVEDGLTRGLSAGAWGKAQGSMGIAVGDANLDRRQDMFVTNFSSESNAMYNQTEPGFFFDQCDTTGHREASMQMLGFGTQFVDGELDGFPDLIIANGHIDDNSDVGESYRMRAQYMRNTGDGRFVEIPAEQSGECFAVEELGRAMARLDWNRDGREDVVISNLDTPASLFTNISDSTGHALSVVLCGRRCERDATGATVTVTDGDRVRSQQVIAGHGYQCTNQRLLVFGLGAKTRVAEIEIRWPSGQVDVFHDVEADTAWTIIEGGADPLRLPD